MTKIYKNQNFKSPFFLTTYEVEVMETRNDEIMPGLRYAETLIIDKNGDQRWVPSDQLTNPLARRRT
jgi:hypothetical protein